MNTSELVETIEAKRGTEVRMHPYGFLQLSLSEGAWRDAGNRLHVWSDDLPQMKRPEFQVHNHIYGVRSKVKIGALRDTHYVVEWEPKGHAEYLLFTSENGKLIDSGEYVSCSKRNARYIRAGEEYSIVKGDYHTSESLAPLTVTLFQKRDADLSMSPSVVGPVYYEMLEVLSDNRTIDQKDAWSVIDKALKELRKMV